MADVSQSCAEMTELGPPSAGIHGCIGKVYRIRLLRTRFPTDPSPRHQDASFVQYRPLALAAICLPQIFFYQGLNKVLALNVANLPAEASTGAVIKDGHVSAVKLTEQINDRVDNAKVLNLLEWTSKAALDIIGITLCRYKFNSLSGGQTELMVSHKHHDDAGQNKVEQKRFDVELVNNWPIWYKPSLAPVEEAADTTTCSLSLTMLSVGVRNWTPKFAVAKKLRLGPNRDRGGLEGGMKGIALALQRRFKSSCITNARDGWKWFVAPKIERLAFSFPVEVGLRRIRKTVGADIGGVARLKRRELSGTPSISHADAALIDAYSTGADSPLRQADIGVMDADAYRINADTCLLDADTCLIDADIYLMVKGMNAPADLMSSILGANPAGKIVAHAWENTSMAKIGSFDDIQTPSDLGHNERRNPIKEFTVLVLLCVSCGFSDTCCTKNGCLTYRLHVRIYVCTVPLLVVSAIGILSRCSSNYLKTGVSSTKDCGHVNHTCIVIHSCTGWPKSARTSVRFSGGAMATWYCGSYLTFVTDCDSLQSRSGPVCHATSAIHPEVLKYAAKKSGKWKSAPWWWIIGGYLWDKWLKQERDDGGACNLL
ncbi:hypothetical protein ARMSODRAFT_979648 [Armillaria solidipes]|uniref:Uncharacterized protein n=1 Tax=Armillaria solidipes TaxID=1076256 RepID=A0A2H3BIU5_9AGAR|nr:hypothetical protein ARMSODRAFT_979648 [Armillaria solidipes]